ncbi:DUF2019 domain-containing protein [Cystobacter ferrugineus]|uniref:DUF2019 domain-containing protein n=1 Tax=Cystobacter ferrugineus TaxID=83449 RepID=UPI003183B9D3
MTELEKLVAEFAENVAAQTDSVWKGDAKTGNKHAKRYIAAFGKLTAHGDVGRDALTVLFTHPRMDVRVSAAAYLLRYRTTEARAILEEAAKGKGLVSFEASQVLKNWESGSWTLDPAKDAAEQPTRPASPSKRSRPRTERTGADRRKRNKRDKPGS